MVDTVVDYRFLVRRGTAAIAASVNEILRKGELFVETDTGLMKFGDGVSHYNSLTYLLSGLLPDPGGDRLVFWDDSAGRWVHLALGTGLSITGTTLNSSAGSGAVTLVGTSTLGGAATTLSISGLDLDADGHYIVEFSLKNATASLATISLYYNADTTATNYDSQVFRFTNNTTSGARANTARFAEIVASACAVGDFRIVKNLDNRPRAEGRSDSGATTAIQDFMSVQSWRTTGTNVTGFTLSSDVANALAAGSFVKVWKIN